MALRPVYASDIYAVGVTCIYLLTGKSPKDLDYNPSTGEMVWQKYVQISDHFAEVLKKMLEASVRHRYQVGNRHPKSA
jgi:serine/threonine-protein kinase